MFVPLTPAERADLKKRADEDSRTESSMARVIYIAGLQALGTTVQS